MNKKKELWVTGRYPIVSGKEYPQHVRYFIKRDRDGYTQYSWDVYHAKVYKSSHAAIRHGARLEDYEIGGPVAAEGATLEWKVVGRELTDKEIKLIEKEQ